MKILMVPEFFPPVLGGLERHVFDLSGALAARGHDVRVVTLGWKGMVPHETVNGFDVTRISGGFQYIKYIYENQNRRFHPPIPDPLLVKKLSDVIQEFKPDVVHSHGWILYSLLAAKRKLGFPLVVTLHDYGLICPNRTLLRNDAICSEQFTANCVPCCEDSLGLLKSRVLPWLVKRYRDDLALVDKYVAVSSFVGDAYRSHLSGKKDRLSIVPNFFKANNETGGILNVIEDSDSFILYVGGFSFVKGLNIILQAYQKLKPKDIKLLIIGIGNKGLFSNNGNSNIIMLENQPHKVVMEAWRRCLFGVVPSIWPEPCPTVAFEAMRSGKALVASDIGGLKDIIKHGETGLLVPPGDIDGLAEALFSMIDNPVATNNYGVRGRARYLEKFALNRVVSSIEDVYASCK